MTRRRVPAGMLGVPPQRRRKNAEILAKTTIVIPEGLMIALRQEARRKHLTIGVLVEGMLRERYRQDEAVPVGAQELVAL